MAVVSASDKTSARRYAMKTRFTPDNVVSMPRNSIIKREGQRIDPCSILRAKVSLEIPRTTRRWALRSVRMVVWLAASVAACAAVS
jgi:hypothetical protein